MKTIYPLVLFFILFSVALSAQTPSLKISKVTFGFASELEMMSGLDGHYLASLSRKDLSSIYDLDRFGDHTLEAMSCENPNIRIGIGLTTPLLPKFEVLATISYIKDRIDMTYYQTYDHDGGFLQLHNRTNEIGLDLALNRVFAVGKSFHLYAGAGTVFGYSYQGRLNIWADDATIVEPIQAGEGRDVLDGGIDTFEPIGVSSSFFDYRSKNALHVRGFGQLGFGFIIGQRMEISTMYRLGLGLRAQRESKLRGSTLESFQMGLAWRLRQ
ncbi:MAG: hypothetical protein KTR24_03385 [Saprospiraceae bacterium]|nr:hypothetical protein [Saprospiraceae bacterium]